MAGMKEEGGSNTRRPIEWLSVRSTGSPRGTGRARWGGGDTFRLYEHMRENLLELLSPLTLYFAVQPLLNVDTQMQFLDGNLMTRFWNYDDGQE